MKNILHACPLDVLHQSNCRPAIGVLRGVKGFGEQGRNSSVGAIGIVLAVLVLDDVFLNPELGVGQGTHQVGHTVGFDCDGRFEMGRGEVDVVVRTIRGCRSIDFCAEFLEVFEEVSGVVFGAFEHQVLDEVREPTLIPFFIL